MATGQLSCTLDHLLRRFARGDSTARGDEQLLEKFAKHRDEKAFEALLGRHGPMVLEVCRRALFDPAAAEDAFQATFLVLIQKAGSIRKGELLGNWLHGVASRITARARVEAARRRARESASTTTSQPTDPLAQMTMRECLAALDEEITRLPARQRAPLVLCYLEGRTRDQAAHELGYSLATLDRRLKESRERLRGRLAARGVTFSGALLVAALGEQAGRAALPESLKTSAVNLAAGTAAGARVTALSEGVLKGMLLGKLKIGFALLVFAAVLGVGTGTLVLRTCAADGAGGTPVKAPEASAPEAGQPGKQKVAADMEKLQGTWVLVSDETDGKASDTAPKDVQLTITGNRYQWTVDRSPRHRPYGTFALDPTKQPKEIDFAQCEGIPQEKPNQKPGLYKLDGATLKICMAYAVRGGKRPTDFTTKPGSGRLLFVFRRRAADELKKGAPDAGKSGKERRASDLDKLQGTWAAVSYEVDGKVDPEPVEKGLRLTIEGNRFMLRQKIGLHFPHGTFVLDAGKQPRAIDFTQTHGLPREEPVLIPGIYEFDGTTLKICRAVSGGNRPTDFTTKPGSGRQLLVFWRPAVGGAKQEAPMPDAWSRPVNGLCGRLRIVFAEKHIPASNRGGVITAEQTLVWLDSQVELKNDSAKPLAVPNHFLLEARVFDAAGKEIKDQQPLPSSAGIVPLAWRDVPLGGSLGGYVSLPAYLSRNGSFFPLESYRSRAKGDGTVYLFLGEREWLLKPGRYRAEATLTVEKAKSSPADAWSGRLELPPLEFAVAPEQVGLPPSGSKQGKKHPKDLDRLQGSWIASTLEENGVAIPLVKPVPGGAQYRMIGLTFKDKSFRLQDGDKAWQGTFSIDSKAKPKAMDFTWKRFGGGHHLPEQTLIARVIYDLNGKTLKVRHGPRTAPTKQTGKIISVWGEIRPKDFGPGRGWETIVYHRIPDMPKKTDSTAVLLETLEEKDYPFINAAPVRAAAIDLLADRKAREAIPKLIELLADGAGLTGSDNYVGGHAANALSAITGQSFHLDQKEWRRWWRTQGEK